MACASSSWYDACVPPSRSQAFLMAGSLSVVYARDRAWKAEVASGPPAAGNLLREDALTTTRQGPLVSYEIQLR